MNPGGIGIQVHPEATGAGLVRGIGRWFLALTGPLGVDVKVHVITDSELGDALGSGHRNADVIAYIERRIAAAGFIVHRRLCDIHEAVWALTPYRRAATVPL